MSASHHPRSVRHGGALFALSPAVTGTLSGIAAAIIWATYLVFAKSGTAGGLMPQDFVLLRFGAAAAIMLPWLLRNDPIGLAGIGWRRAIVLALLAGPPFILLGTAGYVFAPLAHGAVIQPSTITLASMLAAAFLLNERLTRDKLIGVGLIIAGLAVIASHASAMGGGQIWIGDLLFVAAGLSWTGFTILIKRWELGAFAVTAAVSTVSAIVVVPAMLIFGDTGRITALPPATLAAQLIVQGALSGVVAVIAFGVAVRQLGAAKAGLFPAIVPAATLIVGTVVTGAMPTVSEGTGAALATLGLMTAIGLVRPIFTPTRQRILAKG
jgi:drug/metabolite transporter (DMT)-like permease